MNRLNPRPTKREWLSTFFSAKREWLSTFFSAKDVFTVKNLCVMAMLLAVGVVMKAPVFNIYLTPNQKIIGFEFIPEIIVAYMFGPWGGMAYALALDTVGFLVFPQGAYFFGYAISEMLTLFIYALFVYKQPLRLWKLVIAQAVVTLVVFYGTHFLWGVVLWGADTSFWLNTTKLVINLATFPVIVLMKYFVVRELIPRVVLSPQRAAAGK
ncbi:MAG: folate family ECF transporter S component [Oscillospiraceae bacterium]|jgi:ECF transporter S component (folate family)|nr:folate family ECF transporter S component [Oscillospiraceae bacterium]